MTAALRRIAFAVLALCLLWPAGSRAETLITSLSTHRLQIQANFVGAQIVLFGSIERDAQTVSRASGYDLAVIVRGPPATIVTRRKDRVLGIFVNVESREFIEAPAAFATITNRPAAEIADLNSRRRARIGLDALIVPQRAAGPGEVVGIETPDPFREALTRLLQGKGLYQDIPNGVTFLTPTLFRANIPVGANTPVGAFDVDIVLLSGGVVLARATTNFEVTKTGFEAFVANSARDHGALYGLATAALALMTGWLASVIFRKD